MLIVIIQTGHDAIPFTVIKYNICYQIFTLNQEQTSHNDALLLLSHLRILDALNFVY